MSISDVVTLLVAVAGLAISFVALKRAGAANKISAGTREDARRQASLQADTVKWDVFCNNGEVCFTNVSTAHTALSARPKAAIMPVGEPGFEQWVEGVQSDVATFRFLTVDLKSFARGRALPAKFLLLAEVTWETSAGVKRTHTEPPRVVEITDLD